MASGVDLKLEVKGDAELVAMLGKLGLDMKDLRSAMGDVGKGMKTFFSGNVFASRGGAIGEPWPRLNSAYAVQKAKRWPGRPPLIKTGLMQKSFSYSTTNDSVTISNKAPYFVYHQSSGARRRLPRRVMLKLTEQVASDAQTIVGKALSDKIRKRAKA